MPSRVLRRARRPTPPGGLPADRLSARGADRGGAVKHHPGAPSEIKRMWVSPDARGLGVGRRLLGELEALAADTGATVARLETNRALIEAIALYRSAGYGEVPPFNDEPFADHWFEKSLRP